MTIRTDSEQSKSVAREITLVDLYRSVRRYKRPLAIAAVAGSIIAVGIALILARQYTVTASFVPQKKEAGAGLSGLAAQIGFVLPTAADGESPEFYADLVTSRTILGQVADSLYSVDSTTAPTDLATLFDIDDADVRKRREKVVDKLRKIARAEKTRTTGVVAVTVTTPWPEVSYRIAKNMIGLVGDFNVHTRQSRAAAERKFVEERLQTARAELRDAERELSAFSDGNRIVSGSTELQLRRNRLQRMVGDRGEVVAGLEQSYEKSRIEEVRDTPVITLVEAPVVPARPNPRRLPGTAVLGFIVGLLVMSFALAARSAVRALNRAVNNTSTQNTAIPQSQHG